MYQLGTVLSVVAFRAIWLLFKVDFLPERMLFWRASWSFPATWSNDHWLMEVSEVMMLVDAISHIGSSLEWKEQRRMNAKNESSKPALTALRVVFFEQ